MFILKSLIDIGKYTEVKPLSVSIEKSVFSFVDRCTITIPIRAKITNTINKFNIVDNVSTLIKAGEKVVVKLAYGNDFQKEFEGYVTRVNQTKHVKIECEGYSYELRQQSYSKSFKDTTVKQILSFLIKGTSIKLADNIPDIPLSKFTINNLTGIEVLNKLKQELIKCSITFTDNILYTGLIAFDTKQTVKYWMDWNVIADDNFKLKEAVNGTVILNITGEKRDGSKVEVSQKKRFNGGTIKVKHLKSHAVTDKSVLTSISKIALAEMSYNGYEGKLSCFLQPFCLPGYTAIIIDEKYKERSGRYFIESIAVNYGVQGARRIIGLGERFTESTHQ